MCDVKSMLYELIRRTCEPVHMVGSPAYGALKYAVPECDLTILKRRVRLPIDEKLHKFGINLQHGAVWMEWEIDHTACVAQVHRLDSFGVQCGHHVQEYYVDPAWAGRVRAEQVEWVGDPQVLQDALTYLNMVQ